MAWHDTTIPAASIATKNSRLLNEGLALQAGLSELNSPGGDSPGLPTGRPVLDQQQLESMLSIHGLRDGASDD